MADWRRTTIGAVAEIFDGPHATPAKTSAGPWFLSISSLGNGRLDLAGSAHLSEQDFERWTRRVTPVAGDVLFSYETKLGAAALMPEGLRACLGRRMALLRPRNGAVDARFLLYLYIGPQFQATLRARAVSGATVDRIPLGDLANWPISVPDQRTQQAIAAVLGTLDEKIHVNTQVAATSDALACAIFEGAAAGSGRVEKLGALVDLVYGRALREPDRRRGCVPVFGCTGQVGWHDTALRPAAGAVVGRKGANAGAVSWSSVPCWVIDTAFYVEPRSAKVTSEFAFFLLRNAGLESLVGDSAVPGLNRTAALAQKVPDVPEAAMERFTRAARPLLRVIDDMKRQNQTLAKLRDALLPGLLSGEIRVRDAEKITRDMP